MSNLTVRDAERLADLEVTIAQGLTTFIEVGAALAEIRETRLYRESHGTFEDYCRDRWQMSKRHADRLIGSAEVVGNLGPIGPTPATESQARPLASLPPEQQREAWSQAVETAPEGKITARHVAATVRQVTEPEGGNPVAAAPMAPTGTGQRDDGVTDHPGSPPARAVVQPRPYTPRMKALVSAAADATHATEEEIAAIPANDMMLQSLRNAREVLDRIIAHHTKERKHG